MLCSADERRGYRDNIEEPRKRNHKKEGVGGSNRAATEDK